MTFESYPTLIENIEIDRNNYTNWPDNHMVVYILLSIPIIFHSNSLFSVRPKLFVPALSTLFSETTI